MSELSERSAAVDRVLLARASVLAEWLALPLDAPLDEQYLVLERLYDVDREVYDLSPRMSMFAHFSSAALLAAHLGSGDRDAA